MFLHYSVIFFLHAAFCSPPIYTLTLKLIHAIMWTLATHQKQWAVEGCSLIEITKSDSSHISVFLISQSPVFTQAQSWPGRDTKPHRNNPLVALGTQPASLAMTFNGLKQQSVFWQQWQWQMIHGPRRWWPSISLFTSPSCSLVPSLWVKQPWTDHMTPG